MTEFEKYWERTGLNIDKEVAEKIWHAAQGALLRITDEQVIPKIGDKIRFKSLCHPKYLNQIREVTSIEKVNLDFYWIETHNLEEDTFSGGILGEVEIVNPTNEQR